MGEEVIREGWREGGRERERERERESENGIEGVPFPSPSFRLLMLVMMF